MKKLQNFYKPAVIVILAGIALVLGFFIFRTNPSFHNLSAFKTTPKTIQNSSPQTGALRTDEQKLFDLPPPNATADQIQKHADLAAKLAVLGSEIDLNECRPTPLVLQVKTGAEVTVKNSGQSDAVLTFDAENVFHVNAGKTGSIKAAFKHGAGLYGYRCKSDTFDAIAGFIALTP